MRRVGLFFVLSISLPGAPVSFRERVQPVLAAHCLACHGDAQKMSQLDLRTREAAIKGGVKGSSLTPGNATASSLYRRIAGLEQPAMPLGTKLAAADVAAIKQWIEEGAVWDAAPVATASAVTGKITEADRKWWAFQKPVRGVTAAGVHPVDGFLEKSRGAKGVATAPEAGRHTLIRRAWLDLLGLLPPAAEVERWANEKSADWWPRLVDTLLASPHYGERWGRHWLDLARYADSMGYEQDFNYPNAWRYRDYVVRAFNEDKPYDQFIREQLAGDELDNPSYDALIATGFHRVGPRVGFREKDNPSYRYTYLDDMIGTTGRAFLGMSVNCARCHDHKFDPIPQADYYKMMAVFFPYVDVDHPLAPAAEVAAYEKAKAAVEARLAPLKSRIAALEAPYRAQAFEKKLATFPQDIQVAVRTPEGERTEGQKLLAAQVLSIRGGNYRALMTAADSAELAALEKQVKEISRDIPKALPVAMGIRDGDYRFQPDGPGDEPLPGKGSREDFAVEGSYVPVAGKPYVAPAAHFLDRGDFLSKKDEVQPGFLEVIAGSALAPTAVLPKDGRPTSGRRRALAEWIASAENPLTARVMVNRLWHHHFGRGIVSTPSNFGRLGQLPSHPELLDWLATEFVAKKWSIKAMHRLVMTSAAYRMESGYHHAASAAADPENVGLWRFPERRLEAEIVRDIVLEASGNLNRRHGGAPYFPEVAERVLKGVAKGIWVKNADGPELWRRGLYSYYKRGMRYPMFEVLDQPDPNTTCEMRNTSTVATQALTLMNSEFVIRQARAFAERVVREAGVEQDAQVRAAYMIALGRAPSAGELSRNVAFLNRQAASYGGADGALKALTDLCDVVLNLNEFVYLQ